MNLVRLWYRKEGAAKYMSHLDLVRVMGRVFHRARIPLWYTEGFNPHPFMTFALPLSLGTVGLRESVDIKLEQELSEKELMERMNPCLPEGITVFDVTQPEMKPGEIVYGKYRVFFTCDAAEPEALLEALRRQLEKKELLVEKKSKKGVRLFDLKPAIQEYALALEDETVRLEIVLPAGSTLNVNPSLFTQAFCLYTGLPIEETVIREDILNREMKSFR